MIPNLEDMLNLLESVAPFRLAEPWDNSGLQLAATSREINKVFIALDPTLDVIRRASQGKAQMVLTHHPLLFKPLISLRTDFYPGNVIFEAMRAGISVVALHTNLDSASGGINDILAELLDLREIQVLQPGEREDGTGLGRIGNLYEPITLREMAIAIKALLGRETLRMVGDPVKRVLRVAVLGGSGGGMIPQAFGRGADLLITGDVGHHHALEAQALDLALIDGGHFHTENAALKIFAGRLADLFRESDWETTVEFDSGECDPIRSL